MKNGFLWFFSVIGLLALVALFSIAVPGRSLLSAAIITPANAESGCSLQTLHGAYIYSADGVVITAPGQFTPIAEAGIYTFDGSGALTTTNTISFGGQIIPRTDTGTYNVNSDCTGVVNLTEGVTFNFALTRSASEMRLVVASPSASVAGTMTRQ